MPPLNLVRAFVMQWWTVGIVICYLSVRTVYQGLGHGHELDPHAAVIGGLEAIAALLFLIPPTMKIGATALITIFAVVFLMHAARMQFRGDLLVYAAAVWFVAVHGPVPLGWMRARA